MFQQFGRNIIIAWCFVFFFRLLIACFVSSIVTLLVFTSNSCITSSSMFRFRDSVGSGWFSISLKCSFHLLCCSSVNNSFPSLLLIGTLMFLRSLVIFLTMPYKAVVRFLLSVSFMLQYTSFRFI
jgi:hypothetical protein